MSSLRSFSRSVPSNPGGRPLRARFQQPGPPLRRQRVPIEPQLLGIGPRRLLAAQRALGEMVRTWSGIASSRAMPVSGSSETDVGRRSLRLLREMRLIQRAGFLDQPIELFRVERADPAVLAEHRVGTRKCVCRSGSPGTGTGSASVTVLAVLLAPPSSVSGARYGGRRRSSRRAPRPSPPAALALGGATDVISR